MQVYCPREDIHEANATVEDQVFATFSAPESQYSLGGLSRAHDRQPLPIPGSCLPTALNPLGGLPSSPENVVGQRNRSARVVRLDVDGGDLAVLNHDCVALGPLAAKDDGGVAKAHVHGLGEGAGRVGQEADLSMAVSPCPKREGRLKRVVSGLGVELTPVCCAGSRLSPQAFMLFGGSFG